jgi:DNA primase
VNFSDQLKSQLDIVKVVEDYVRLKKQGTRYMGLCPFHSEKRASFSVNQTLQMYKCFRCGASGDVFKFVAEHDHLTIPEAIELLKERYRSSRSEQTCRDDPESFEEQS